MGFFSRLFYLSARQRLPRLRHHLTNGRKMDERKEDVHLLLEAGVMRDWSQAERVIKRSKKPVEQLYWELSKAAQPRWQERLKNRFIRMFGGLTYDPHRSEIKRLEKGIYTHDGKNSRAYRIMPGARSRNFHTRRR